MSLLLRNATYIDWQSLEIRACDILVEDGPGGGITFDAPAPRGIPVHECDGRIVTRSWANGHHHIYSALARGMPPPPRKPTSFVEILELIWWRLDRALTPEMVRACALAAGIEAARNGCTFINDHHASPNAAEGSLHTIAEALDEVGIAHLLCYELSDRDGPERQAAGLAETEAYLAHRSGLIGLHASFTVGDALLERAVGIARDHGTGVHIHVAEAPSDQEHCLREHGCRVIERLARVGVLDLDGTILAHCLHLDDAERILIRGSPAWVVHCTQSNQNNAVGRFEQRGLGDRVMIGLDGMHGDVPAGARAMYLEGQTSGGLSPMDAYRRMRRVHDYIHDRSIPGDGPNNLVVLDYRSPTPITGENWPAHLMFGVTGGHVRSVISNGRLIVDSGRITTVDEDRVLAQAQEQAQRLWAKL